jgi:ABC-type amino acid transport substrate-binding protein
MNSRAVAAILMVVAFTFATTGVALAHDAEKTLDKIKRTGEFVIGYRADASPLSYKNGDGEPSGYSVDLCRRIAVGVKKHLAATDIETKFVQITADERLSAVVDGKVDIECGSTTITLSRQEKVDFSMPTFVTGGSILSLAAAGIQDISDLAGKKVGVARGTTTVEQLKKHLAENLIDAKIVILDNRKEGMRQLGQGAIDALASDQIVLIGQVIESANPQRYSIIDDIYSYEPYGFAMRRNDAEFRLVVNSAIAQIFRSGQQGEIFYRWIGRVGISVPPILAAMYQLGAIPE